CREFGCCQSMPDELLDAMRALRLRAQQLNRTVVEDYDAFRNPFAPDTFYRLPSKQPENKGDIGITPTCTAYMALALTGSLRKLFDTKTDSELRGRLERGIEHVLSQDWPTAGLKQNNAFTTSLILRSVSTLMQTGLVEKRILDAQRSVRDREAEW